MAMKLKKIPKQVILLGFVSFFTDFASEMLYPIVPLFLTTVLSASMSTVGLIEGIAEVTAGILKGFFGSLSDKMNKRSLFVRLGYSISAIVKPLPGFFPYVGTVFFSRITDRIGKGIRTAPRDALLSANSEGNSGAIFGFHRGMDTLGAVIGPLVAIGILYLWHGKYEFVFWAALIPGILAIYFTLLVKDPAQITKKGETLYDPSEIHMIFNNQVDLMLANGVLKGEPSTIVDLTDEEPYVIREGAGDVSVFF